MKEAFEKIKDFLKSKFDYCAEQAEMNLDAECGSEIASYFRERKELYLDRANIYGEVMREVDRIEAKYGNGWISVEKSLPEEDGWYLVYTKPDKGYKSINKAQFIKNYDYHWHGAGGIWRNVAYWMPLPKSPI